MKTRIPGAKVAVSEQIMQVTANGIRLEYEVAGPAEGPPLILIRGLGSQMIHWPAELIIGFAQLGYRVVTFDNRDVGLSQRCPAPGVETSADRIIEMLRAGLEPPAAYTLFDMANDVVGLMNVLKIRRAHIFGISMGGGIAQILASDHADRVLSATIVMSAAHFQPDRIAAVLVQTLDRDAFIDAAVTADRSWGSPGYPLGERTVRAIAAAAFDRGADSDGVNRQALATIAAGDRRPRLGGITVPCLVIHGAADTLIPPEVGREIASMIPGADFEMIDGMGHTITPLLSPRIIAHVDAFCRGNE